jgi:hypothetical protein
MPTPVTIRLTLDYARFAEIESMVADGRLRTDSDRFRELIRASINVVQLPLQVGDTITFHPDDLLAQTP